jgi:hypothetical protein
MTESGAAVNRIAVSMLAGVAAVGLTLLTPVAIVPEASADHMPADKIAVSASVVEVMQTQAGPGGGSSGPVTLLSATFRNSTPTDLIIQVTAECALWTDIVSPDSEAAATVTVWVELDGVRVPVTRDTNEDGVFNDPDDGRVVFCNRAFRISAPLSVGDVIRLFLKTRSANAFNWGALNVGNGIHQLVVKAQLDASVIGLGTFAQAAVGKRTLVVQPAKLANDAEF